MATSTAYPIAASYFHWFAAAPMIMSIGSVLKAQDSPKSEKGLWMHRHKSFGLLSGIIVAPRVGYRLMNATKVCVCIYNLILGQDCVMFGKKFSFVFNMTSNPKMD